MEKVDGVLTEKGKNESVINQFIGILNDCEFARFAPSESLTVNKTYDQAVDIIQKIEA